MKLVLVPSIYMLAALCACSNNDVAAPLEYDLPQEISQTFDICLAAMTGIDQAVSVATNYGWKVEDNRQATEFGKPQSHIQSVNVSRKYLNEDQSSGKGQQVSFGRSIYPLGERFFCHEVKFRDDTVENYNLFYEKISEIKNLEGLALTYDACSSLRCKGNMNGQWNFKYNNELIWLTSQLNDATFNLTFEKIKNN